MRRSCSLGLQLKIQVAFLAILLYQVKLGSSFCSRPWSSSEQVILLQQQSSTNLLASNSNNNDKERSQFAVTGNPDVAGVSTLQKQVAALRKEAENLKKQLEEEKERKRQKQMDDVDRWIEQCLYVTFRPVQRVSLAAKSSSGSSRSSNENDDNDNDEDTTTTTTTTSATAAATAAAATVELLNSVEVAAQILRDERYSHEQVSKMFDRICETSTAQSRSNCSPLLALLVDAAGTLDCVEWDENPNKRWDGRVERDLRQRLFAMDWNIHLEPKRESDRFL